MHDATLYYVEGMGVEKSFTCKFILTYYDVEENIMTVQIRPRVHVKNVGWELQCRPTIDGNQFILTPADGTIQLSLTTWTKPEDSPLNTEGEREEKTVYIEREGKIIHTTESVTYINIKKIIISEKTMRHALENTAHL